MGESDYPELGTIQRHRVRDAFRHEANVFTPWLADNLDLLGDELGVPLTLVGTEVAVGSFSLDIQASDPDGRTVVIENQFGRTDHDHLGKALVYSAGLDASIVVWVAEEFREEHRAVFDWLNTHSHDDVAFFAVTVSTLTIDDSAPAPMFEVACRPNEFQREAKPEGRRWDRDRFLEALGETDPAYLPIARRMFEVADEREWRCWHGTGAIFGSAFFYCRNSRRPMLFGIYTDGHFRGGWSNHRSHQGDDRWEPLIEFFLNLDPSKTQNADYYSNLKMDVLANDGVLDTLFEVVTAVEDSFLEDGGATGV